MILFFGDGVIKCDDDPDECGDGPHLIVLIVCVFFWFEEFGLLAISFTLFN